MSVTQAGPRDRRYFDPEIQTMPLERVRALQAERLRRQLDRVWNTPVPFFKRKLEAAGLRICNFISSRRQILLWDLHEKAFEGLPVTLGGHNPDIPGVEASRVAASPTASREGPLAGRLAVETFQRFRDERDLQKAVRYFSWLADEYPASTLREREDNLRKSRRDRGIAKLVD